MLRNIFVLVHRYLGLATAVFLFICAFTGSLLVWQEELDAWLNPDLLIASTGQALPPNALLQHIERQAPGTAVSFMMYPREPSKSLYAFVTNYPNKTQQVVTQLFLDPVTGAVLGGRNSSNPGFNRQEFVRWLYKLHYELTIGQVGRWILGLIAVLWLINCLVAFYLTLPRPGLQRLSKWKRSWWVNKSRFNFELHRASGLWLYPV